jgi:biotin/methionine sulfoxide reductase
MPKALPLGFELTSSHWGAYEVVRDADGGGATGLAGFRGDPAPSPIGLAMWDAYRSPLRIRRPAVRAGWLERPPGDPRRGEGRGREPFVEVSWPQALDLVGAELRRVIDAYGNEAVFGGSYGWSSAGRFHHAQSQVHRFLNAIGGYVRHTDSYSLGAGRVLLPHVLAPMEYLLANQHDWATLAAHTRLFVSFGGAPAKNAQVGAGGASEHGLPGGLAALAAAGCRFVNFSPVRADLDVPADALEWIPIRPGTDTAVMLALACETVRAGRHDRAFLAGWCVGFERWEAYLLGRDDGIVKDADWAAPIAGVPAARLRTLAAELVATRSLVNVAWALQRADHGEQPFWAAIGLACVIGQVGLPGGGVALSYGPANTMGSPHRQLPGPTLPQGRNAVEAFIPVARIADMLLSPGAGFDYNGQRRRYPHIRLVYWAGGNPFHHHQDLHRLARAWRRPEAVVVHEQFWNAHAKMADVVLPATSTLERDDIGASTRDPLWIAMRACATPPGEARDDYEIFAALAERLGRGPAFTEGRSAGQWLGSPLAARLPLHLLSDQPFTKLHSQLDHSAYSLANKVAGREPIAIHPDDAAARGIADGDTVRVFNDRGACLAGARLDAGLLRGVVRLSTGAWWDPLSPGDPAALELHGNPNTLTRDAGASSLSQGCAAQTCLVEIARFDGEAPAHRAFEPPTFVAASDVAVAARLAGTAHPAAHRAAGDGPSDRTPPRG